MGRWLTAVLILAFAGLARAEGAATGALEELMRKDPDAFLDLAVDLIAGYGTDKGLRAAGIEDYIALERAAARASELRRFLAMDLNADDVVDRAELAVSQRAASAGARGRLEREFLKADGDGDGRISAAEQRVEAVAAAMRRLGEGEADALRALMLLDANADGALTSTEVEAAVARLDQAT